jgi:signal transduction histidine kinase
MGRAGWSLRTRLAVGFATVVLLVLAAGVAGVLSLQELQREYDELVRRSEPLADANRDILQALTDIETGERGFVISGDEDFLDPYESGLEAFPDAVAEMRELAGDDDELLAMIAEQARAGTLWVDEIGVPIVALARQDLPAARARVETGLGKALFDEFRLANRAAGDAVTDLRSRSAARVEDAVDITTVVLVVVAALAIIGATVLAIITARAVTRPLAALGSSVDRLAAGELGARAPVAGPRELQTLAESVNVMAENREQLAHEQSARLGSERLIRQFADSLKGELDLAALLQTALDGLGPAAGADRAMVAIDPGEARGGWGVVASWTAAGTSPIVEIDPQVLPRTFGLFAGALGSGEMLIVEDVEHDPRLGAEGEAARRELRSAALVTVPLVAGGEVIGLLVLQQESSPRAVTDTERYVLAAVGRELAAAIAAARAYELQRESVARLEELDRQKGEFIATVSHELRTPLTSIVGYVEMLQDGDAGPLSGPQDRMLTVVDRNSQRLLALIEDLLTLSRIESGTFRLERAPVVVADVVERAREAIAPRANAGDVDLQTTVAADVGIVMGDAGQLERVLLNLLSNAVKFTPDGGAVTVRARREGDAVVLEVSDTGIGIPAAEQGRLFERFFRSSTSQDLAVEGTGLGLAIVRTIIEGHSGTIAVESVQDEGTTVRVELPGAEQDG